MAARIENFLGREIIVPEDRMYDPEEGLWLQKQSDGSVAVGLTEATVLMAGRIRQVQMLVDDGESVERGDTVILALTGKLKYLAVPISGKLVHVRENDLHTDTIHERPYESPLFFILPDDEQAGGLLDAVGYANVLAQSEGARNPGGHTGGVSPTCKAVYMGLGAQTLKPER